MSVDNLAAARAMLPSNLSDFERTVTEVGRFTTQFEPRVGMISFTTQSDGELTHRTVLGFYPDVGFKPEGLRYVSWSRGLDFHGFGTRRETLRETTMSRIHQEAAGNSARFEWDDLTLRGLHLRIYAKPLTEVAYTRGDEDKWNKPRFKGNVQALLASFQADGRIPHNLDADPREYSHVLGTNVLLGPPPGLRGNIMRASRLEEFAAALNSQLVANLV